MAAIRWCFQRVDSSVTDLQSNLQHHASSHSHLQLDKMFSSLLNVLLNCRMVGPFGISCALYWRKNKSLVSFRVQGGCESEVSKATTLVKSVLQVGPCLQTPLPGLWSRLGLVSLLYWVWSWSRTGWIFYTNQWRLS